MKTYDAIVVGGGVAGMSAAIYLKRANLKVLLIEKSALGGQVNLTHEIENYPGFKSIAGPDLATNIFVQMNNLGVEIAIEEIKKINQLDDVVEVIGENKYHAKKVIIATGRKPRRLNLPHENELAGRGVSWCAICDGPLYKNKTVLIIGGGKSAVEEGLYLATIAKKVYLINRTENFKADNSELENLKSKSNVEILVNTEIKEFITENNNLKGVKVINHNDRLVKQLDVDGVFVFIGYSPSQQLLEDPVYDDIGYLVVDGDMRTKLKNLYGCGDAIKKNVYQITTAVGEGAIAATSLINDLALK